MFFLTVETFQYSLSLTEVQMSFSKLMAISKILFGTVVIKQKYCVGNWMMQLHPSKVEGDGRRGDKCAWESLGFTSWCWSSSFPQFLWRTVCPHPGGGGSASPRAHSALLCCLQLPWQHPRGFVVFWDTEHSGTSQYWQRVGMGSNPAAHEFPTPLTPISSLGSKRCLSSAACSALLGVLSWHVLLPPSLSDWAGNWARCAFGVIHLSCYDVLMPGGVWRTRMDPILQRQKVFHAALSCWWVSDGSEEGIINAIITARSAFIIS